ncbi:hypothetical protein [Actinophytocola sp.]|uniref:hypothetical protein n=1 Tax=Actinophytocola sp. TaxID=1872138 RepID=UPI002ED58FF8
MTASTTRTDCGCGCGGASAWPSAFVRPRFFAGQLLTEDDLELLVGYVTGKHRLYNRMLSGPGVVCGLEVGCDPCGDGNVVVQPGHALDCCGNDIVLSCKEKVDVQALVRELRVSSLGVDCGEPCEDDGPRRYGLFVRYEESPVDPVAPYSTEEPCPTPGCVPSRIRESLRFLVKRDETDDHRYNPGSRLLASIGDERRFAHLQRVGQRLGFYLDALFFAWHGSGRTIRFDATDAGRFERSLTWLRESGEGTPAASVAVQMTEHVRALASAIARYDTHDRDGQQQLEREHTVLSQVAEARQVLGVACTRLEKTDPEQVWPNELRRELAAAVVAETKARVVRGPADAESAREARLLAHGTPMDNVLQVRFRSDLGELREWLLGRMERSPGVADCSLRGAVRSINLPPLLPRPDPDPEQRIADSDAGVLAEAVRDVILAQRRFVTDAACSTLNPPCTDCTDTDVLLAHVELDGCDVVRVCSATREQVLPGGSMYGEWLPKLFPLRELAGRLCCEPVPGYTPPQLPSTGPVRRPYVEGLLEEWPRTGDLENMLGLLLTPGQGETPPKALHEQLYRVPTEVTDSLHELGMLRSQVGALTATVEALRGQLDTAREQVSQVREELPERLGSRLEELESTPRGEAEAKPPARRTRSTGRTQKPRSGESS